LLNSKLGLVLPQPSENKYIVAPSFQLSPTPQEPGVLQYIKKAKGKLQQIQMAYLIFITKAYKTVSNEAPSAIAGMMPIEQAMQLYKDKTAISRGKPTNAVITALKYVETPIKSRDIHPKDNYVRVE
jgi:hypothetical protein